jgi:hypothetical protein
MEIFTKKLADCKINCIFTKKIDYLLIDESNSQII